MDTPQHFVSLGIASPFTAAIPILIPVNEPGPSVITQPSISDIVRRARLRTESTIGRRVSLCVSPALTNASLISCSPSVIAALAVLADESSASIFNFGTPLQSNYAFILVIILGYRNSNRIFGQTVLDIFAPLNHEHPAHIEIIKKSG